MSLHRKAAMILVGLLSLVLSSGSSAAAQHDATHCDALFTRLQAANKDRDYKSAISLARQRLTHCRHEMSTPSDYAFELGTLAFALNGDGQYSEALPVANRCLEIDPTIIPCAIDKVEALEALGRRLEAKAAIVEGLTQPAITVFDAEYKSLLRDKLASIERESGKAQSPRRVLNFDDIISPAQRPKSVENAGESSVQTAATCARPIRNGDVLDGYLRASGPGHTIEIHNGSGGDAIVKIREAGSGRLAIAFFVAANGSASFKHLPDASYRVQYAVGNQLAPNCHAFHGKVVANQFPEIETLYTRRTENQIIRQRLSYTLYTVPSGNVRPVSLDIGAFNAD